MDYESYLQKRDEPKVQEECSLVCFDSEKGRQEGERCSHISKDGGRGSRALPERWDKADLGLQCLSLCDWKRQIWAKSCACPELIGPILPHHVPLGERLCPYDLGTSGQLGESKGTCSHSSLYHTVWRRQSHLCHFPTRKVIQERMFLQWQLVLKLPYKWVLGSCVLRFLLLWEETRSPQQFL